MILLYIVAVNVIISFDLITENKLIGGLNIFKKTISSFLILLLVFSFVGCNSTSTKKVTKAITKSSAITLGTSKGNVYTNDFFKLTLNIPDKWVVASDEDKNKVIEAGEKIVVGDDKAKAKQIDLSLVKSVYLFMVSAKGLQVQSTNNPNFMVIAEKLSFYQGVKTGADYLVEVRKQLKAVTSITYNLDKPVYTEKVGGKNFSVLEATVQTSTIKMTQKYYACVLNGYALSFISTTLDDEGAKTLDATLKSVTFK